MFFFNPPSISSHFRHGVLTKLEFKKWKKEPDNFRNHVGGANNNYHNARSSCEDIKNLKHSVSYAITCQDDK
jgi:hypothetical protein